MAHCHSNDGDEDGAEKNGYVFWLGGAENWTENLDGGTTKVWREQ